MLANSIWFARRATRDRGCSAYTKSRLGSCAVICFCPPPYILRTSGCRGETRSNESRSYCTLGSHKEGRSGTLRRFFGQPLVSLLLCLVWPGRQSAAKSQWSSIFLRGVVPSTFWRFQSPLFCAPAFTAHRSPLAVRRSPLAARRSPLTAHRSPLRSRQLLAAHRPGALGQQPTRNRCT